MKHNILWACVFVLFLGLAASDSPARSQEKKGEAPKMYYSVDWSKWDKPDDMGRQIIVVIHNSPKGDYRNVIKVKKDSVTIVSQQSDPDGNKITVVFDVPMKLTAIPKRLKIAKVEWNGVAVPTESLATKTTKDKKDKSATPEEKAEKILASAKEALEAKNVLLARIRLRSIVAEYANTAAAVEAERLLKTLPK